jgi:signal transduction histidine kinase
LYPFVQLAQDEKSRKPTREGMFAIYETAAGYDITPYEISETIREINETRISDRRYKRILNDDNLPEKSRASTILGWQAAFRGEFDLASDFFRTNVEIRQQLKNNELLAVAHLYYGFSLFQSLDYEAALFQFESAQEIAGNEGLRNMNSVALALIAEDHLLNGRFEEAATSFRSALDIFSTLGFERESAVMKVELAEIDLRKGDAEAAMPLLEDARQTFIQLEDLPMAAVATRDIGLIHYKGRRYESAIQAFRESLGYSEELSVAKLLRDTYLKLYTISSLLQDHELSNSYHLNYITTRDSIEYVESSRVASSQLTRKELLVRDKITELIESTRIRSYEELSAEELAESRAALEEEIEALQNEKIIEDLSAAKRKSDLLSIEREERIEQLKKEKALQESALSRKELELNRQQTVRNTLFIIVFFAAILALLLYSRFRQQKASNKKLNDAYDELTRTHRQLVDTQEQLVHQKKLASLGTMAAGLAHEIQNPLNFVKNFSELTLEIVNDVRNGEAEMSSAGPLIEDNLKKINEHGTRAETIVKGMLSRSASEREVPVSIDVNELLKEAAELSLQASELESESVRTKINYRLDKDLPDYKGHKRELHEVVSNILNNAFYFMHEKYTIDNNDSYEPELDIATMTDQGHMIISITDNGTGIPQENLEKVFDPFFTTKKGKQGSGLGLSVAYDIITQRHNGGIRVESSEGEFCRFIINLPIQSN